MHKKVYVAEDLLENSTTALCISSTQQFKNNIPDRQSSCLPPSPLTPTGSQPPISPP